MIWITNEQIIRLHHALIDKTGGSYGIRDEKLLEAALAAPMQTFDSKELFPTIIDKAARLAWGLTKNHPFIDGNKRIGAHIMLVVLKLNEISLVYTQNELVDLFLELASGNTSFEDLKAWIISHTEN